MKCILFDLGGVLIELWGEVPLLRMCPHLKSKSALHEAWVSTRAVKEFETGKITYQSFCKRLVEEMNMDISPSEFEVAYRTFLGDIYEGAEELITELKEQYTVACLSNTNSEHMRLLSDRSKFLELFDHQFLSYQIGYIKPDPEAFLYVTRALHMRPSEIFFIDDNELNVKVATEVGMHGLLSNSIEEIREKLLASNSVLQ